MVGFVSEVVQYRKQRKIFAAANPPQDHERQRQPSPSDSDSLDKDSKTKKATLKQKLTPIDLAKSFLARHASLTPLAPPSSCPSEAAPLPPIIIPQRRPSTRSRGFLRAYPPSLSLPPYSIPQSTFLDFLSTLNAALEPNPYLYALNLAGLAGLEAPEPYTLMVGAAVGLATEAIMEAQSRGRSNGFRDELNRGFWLPRGLVCVVATWRPEEVGEGRVFVGVDCAATAAATDGESAVTEPPSVKEKSPSPAEEALRKLLGQMQGRMRSTNADVRFPEPAPLIFPADAPAPVAGEPGGNALDRGERWLDGFMDRRAQAAWLRENPGLAPGGLPRPEFRSRYADPAHPAASGDLVAFATGGRYSTKGKVVGGGDGLAEEKDTSEEGILGEEKNRNKKKGAKGGFLDILRQDTLYLVILPTHASEVGEYVRRLSEKSS